MSNSASLRNDLLFRIAKHWIAGDNYEAGIARAQQSNTDKILGILNLLGEEITAQEEVAAATAEYLDILKTVAAKKVASCISIKPTQLGLMIDRKLYEENMKTILATAKSLNSFVWIDMEGSKYTDDTVETYLEFRKGFDNVGIAIQSYLKRSDDDVNRILDSNGIIRLVKGAYNESSTIAFKRKEEINDSFLKLTKLMFERGKGFAIATHHEKLIEAAAELSKSHPVNFEYEMLMGIRDAKKLELTHRGFQVSEYIPFGKGWWPYSVRRIREHKSNILLLGRSLLGG